MSIPRRFDGSLAIRFAIAVAVLVAVVILTVGFGSWWLMVQQQTHAHDMLLRKDAEMHANIASLRLRTLNERIHGIVQNPLLTTVDTDNIPPDTYLVHFLWGIRYVDGIPIHLLLTDAHGKIIATNSQIVHFSAAQHDWLRTQLESGQSSAGIFKQGESHELVAVEVLPNTRTQQIKGALLYKMSLADLFADTSDMQLIWQNKTSDAAQAKWVRADVATPDIFRPFHFKILQDPAKARIPITPSITHVVFIYSLVGIMVMFLVLMTMPTLGRYLTADLQKLTEFIQQVIHEGFGTQRLSFTRGGEVAKVADAINFMLAHLNMLHELSQQESEVRFRSVFQNAGTGIAFADPEGCILNCNQAFCDLLGYTEAELIGVSFGDFTVEADLQRGVATLSELLNGQHDSYRMEKRYCNRANEIIWVDVSITVLRDAQGQAMNFVGVIIDINDRKKAEMALRENEQRFRSYFALGMIGMAMTSIEKGWLECNDALCQILGYPRNVLWCKTWADITHPDDLAADVAYFDRVVTGEIDSYHMEKRFIQQDGTVINAEIAAKCLRCPDGSIDYFVALVQDITERKCAERNLRDREQQFSTIFQHTPMIMSLSDIETGVMLDMNTKCLELLGFSREEVIGKTSLELGFVTPEDRAQFIHILRTEGRVAGLEIPLYARGGKQLICSYYGEQIEVNGQPLLLSIAEDITERKQIEGELERNRLHLEERVSERTHDLDIANQALRDARDVAESANRAKSLFLANMSHELRTPLNAILGFAHLMQGDHNLTGIQKKNLTTIDRSGQHLLSLINDVLEISRIEIGQTFLNIGHFDLVTLISSVEEMLTLRAEDKGLKLQVLCEESLPQYVEGDAHRLRQVLVNLLGNAVKYTDAGTITLRVSTESDEHISFVVEDTGSGIDTDDQRRIFESFYQTVSGAARGEGTGLGLAISRESVRLMGGELTVESVLQQGSIFRFSLHLPTTDATPALPPPRSVVGLALGQLIPRILIVEDNEANRQLLTQLLERTGFKVRTAMNGDVAIQIFQDWQPHFIWMDMRMPVLDGFAATRHIRTLSGGKQVKIVALTASAFEEDRQKIMAAGCDDFVRKPLNEAQIFQVMAKLLDLQYRYAEVPAEAPEEPAVDIVDMDQAIRQLPPSLSTELNNAALNLDSDTALTVIATIRKHDDALANMLEHMVEDFRFDEVAGLCGH